MSELRESFGLKLFVLLGLSVLFPVVSESADWKKYENDYFVVYSNARQKHAINMAEVLERFRAAVVQISSISIPPDAPKTIVLLPKNQRHFGKLVSRKTVGGFAFRGKGSTILVLPASSRTGNVEKTIRHEFSHALLNFRDFEYPTWYEEGFAELIAEVKFVNDGNSFTVGQVPRRAAYNGKPLYDWNKLVSAKFKPHKISSSRMGSSAYAQAWLLAHFATLGNNLEN